DATCLRLAKALAHAKVEGQHRYLLRASRGGSDVRQDILGPLESIQDALRKIPNVSDRDSLRGHEGAAAVNYFVLV
ncbi:MAG TPA: CRISPR-associated endonuclease Cas1, partial [Pseudolabrys sp.]|nr:CRISPR-associated endonuclease Cas1 [Pseudolabrys sp.]